MMITTDYPHSVVFVIKSGSGDWDSRDVVEAFSKLIGGGGGSLQT